MNGDQTSRARLNPRTVPYPADPDERFGQLLARLKPYGHNADLADSLAQLDRDRLMHETEHGQWSPGIRSDLLQALIGDRANRPSGQVFSPAFERLLLRLAARSEPLVVRTALEALKWPCRHGRDDLKAQVRASVRAIPVPEFARHPARVNNARHPAGQ